MPPPNPCLQPLLTRTCPSAALICPVPRPLLPPRTSARQSPEALWGTASVLALGVQVPLGLKVRGLRTQADVVLLQQCPEVPLGSLQEAPEGLTVVTDVEGQEKAVTEPKKHVPCRPGHGLMAAEACGAGQRGGDKAGLSLQPTLLRPQDALAPVLTGVHKLVHVTEGVEGCVVGGVDARGGLALGKQRPEVTGLRWEEGAGVPTVSDNVGTLSRHCPIYEVGFRMLTLQRKKLVFTEVK